ncbi:hypothetical protein UFOVP638_40 [uncultured Caudovirales phage]|uniref:Uncharacterized protein n=1 Tax=uncultured Caudovirales phage TaxID=2100421 RepID=A0A6J5N350_9CAUD|nr:hypothetical protein UFOVP638_40 [uncultured Caudovirales phage]
MNNYDDWKAGNYETERDEELYTEEQILIEQIERLERQLDNQVKNILRLQGQLKRLSEIEETFSTFGTLTYEEQKEKQIILSIYETI